MTDPSPQQKLQLPPQEQGFIESFSEMKEFMKRSLLLHILLLYTAHLLAHTHTTALVYGFILSPSSEIFFGFFSCSVHELGEWVILKPRNSHIKAVKHFLFRFIIADANINTFCIVWDSLCLSRSCTLGVRRVLWETSSISPNTKSRIKAMFYKVKQHMVCTFCQNVLVALNDSHAVTPNI